jgi:DNA polymerase III alpha subunit
VAALHGIAKADGYGSLGLSRRQSAWAIKALRDEALPLFAAADDRAAQLRPEITEPAVSLPVMTMGREVVEDYRSKGLSLGAHPVAFLRESLAQRGFAPCSSLRGSMCRFRLWQAAAMKPATAAVGRTTAKASLQSRSHGISTSLTCNIETLKLKARNFR